MAHSVVHLTGSSGNSSTMMVNEKIYLNAQVFYQCIFVKIILYNSILYCGEPSYI